MNEGVDSQYIEAVERSTLTNLLTNLKLTIMTDKQIVNRFWAEHENACDDLYYGYGYNFWRTHYNSIEDDDVAKRVWQLAFDKMANN